MVYSTDGDIFQCSENIIVHQVNCKGVMGAGIAKCIAQRFPRTISPYKAQCGKFGANNLGHALIVQGHSGRTKYEHKFIAHVFGQNDFGRAYNTTYTDYDALKRGLIEVEQFAARHGLTVAIPYGIGCNLGGGEWFTVRSNIYEVFGNSPVKAVIYKHI